MTVKCSSVRKAKFISIIWFSTSWLICQLVPFEVSFRLTDLYHWSSLASKYKALPTRKNVLECVKSFFENRLLKYAFIHRQPNLVSRAFSQPPSQGKGTGNKVAFSHRHIAKAVSELLTIFCSFSIWFYHAMVTFTIRWTRLSSNFYFELSVETAWRTFVDGSRDISAVLVRAVSFSVTCTVSTNLNQSNASGVFTETVM